MHKSTSQYYQSQKGNMTLEINGSKARVLSTETGAQIHAFELCGHPVSAAISNHGKWVAALIGSIVNDVFIYKVKGVGTWSQEYHRRSGKNPSAISWDEPDDERYPPIDLLLEYDDKTRAILPLSK